MRKVEVREVECKSVLNRVQAPSMPFHWSINPYRGCQHACVYCYARRYHEYLDLGAGRDFETQIFVKTNAPEVLRRELARASWRREWVAIGTAVDPYQPVEGKYKVTRGILEALCDYDTPASVVTKNTMILRDADLLERLSKRAGCRVYFSVTTMDERVARAIEPDTPPPLKRLQAMRELAARGIEVGVLVAPILPGLTDDEASLRRVALAAAAHGACYLSGAPLRLQGSVRSVYLSFLEEAFPRLKRLYDELYKGDYAPRYYRERIAARIHEMEKILEFDRRLRMEDQGEMRPSPPEANLRPAERPGPVRGPSRDPLRRSSRESVRAPARDPGRGSASAPHAAKRVPAGVALARGAAQLRLFG